MIGKLSHGVGSSNRGIIYNAVDLDHFDFLVFEWKERGGKFCILNNITFLQ